jgi:hypothetical protein
MSLEPAKQEVFVFDTNYGCVPPFHALCYVGQLSIDFYLPIQDLLIESYLVK